MKTIKIYPLFYCKKSTRVCKEKRINYVIFDTAGRLAIDEELMNELMQINKEIDSDEVLLALDAMTGQDAVNSGNEFNKHIQYQELY